MSLLSLTSLSLAYIPRLLSSVLPILLSLGSIVRHESLTGVLLLWGTEVGTRRALTIEECLCVDLLLRCSVMAGPSYC